LEEFRNRQTHAHIVAASGCFDVLHIGHLRYLQHAKRLGSCVVVGVNSDESVRAIKGPARPINSENERAELILAIRVVDYAFVFNEPRATRFLAALRPHVWVKGGDYTLETLDQNERMAVEMNGGRITFSATEPGKSSTSLIDSLHKQAAVSALVLES
jgi:rfaE bifunctional protein nucleotidyltransferase chain/domain